MEYLQLLPEIISQKAILLKIFSTIKKLSAMSEKSHLNHLFIQDLRAILDSGSELSFPDGLLINGHGSNAYTFMVNQGI